MQVTRDRETYRHLGGPIPRPSPPVGVPVTDDQGAPKGLIAATVLHVQYSGAGGGGCVMGGGVYGAGGREASPMI